LKPLILGQAGTFLDDAVAHNPRHSYADCLDVFSAANYLDLMQNAFTQVPGRHLIQNIGGLQRLRIELSEPEIALFSTNAAAICSVASMPIVLAITHLSRLGLLTGSQVYSDR
jgi:hypothetical protein